MSYSNSDLTVFALGYFVIKINENLKIMSGKSETFFTTVGCMDGRVQAVVAEFGRKKFDAKYPDTITEAGLVGKLARESPDQGLTDSIRNKLEISLKKHHSKGIIIHGHQECTGNPVDDQQHRDDVRKSVERVRLLINSSIPTVGVFVRRSKNNPDVWKVERL